MSSLLLLAWLGLEPWHLFLVFIVALLLFGNRLPEIGRSLGRGILEFKKGLKDFQDEVSKPNPDRDEENRRGPERRADEERKQLSEPRTPPADAVSREATRETTEVKQDR